MAITESTQSPVGRANVIAFTARMRTPPKSWRARVGALIDQAEGVMREVKDGVLEDATWGNGPYARQLIGDALDLCGRDTDVLLCGHPSDCYGWCVLPATAMLVGAAAMADVYPSIDLTLRPAIDALEEAGRILDQADADSL